MRQQIFYRKSWYAPSYSYFFFDTKKLPENRRVPLQSLSLRSCETKNFDKTMMPPLLFMKNFDKRILRKLQSVLKWNFSVRWDINFGGKSWYAPLLSIKYFSLPDFFWNTEWFPSEVFSVLWDKKNFDKTVKFPPLLPEKCRYQNSFETQKGSLTKFFGTVRQRIFERK